MLSGYVGLYGVNAAVWVMLSFMVTVATASVPVYEPFPTPDQPAKYDPAPGIARISTAEPGRYDPVGGVTVPFPIVCIVRRRPPWLKCATSVIGAFTTIENVRERPVYEPMPVPAQ